jgi:hypothetical protein
MIDIIDHILIAVPELDGPVADYTKLTGRLPSWRGSHPGLGSVNALFRFSNTYIELVAPKGEGRFGDILRAHLEKNGAGIIGLAFRAFGERGRGPGGGGSDRSCGDQHAGCG